MKRVFTALAGLLVAVAVVFAVWPERDVQESAASEAPDVVLAVRGMVCPLCAASMEKALKEVDGVADVHVQLDEQRVLLTLAKGARAELHVLRTAVHDAGFLLGDVNWKSKESI